MAPHLTPAQNWLIDLAAKDVVEQQRGGTAVRGLIAQSVTNMVANSIGIESAKLRDALKYRCKVLRSKMTTPSSRTEVPGTVTVAERTEISAVTASPVDLQDSSSPSKSSRPGRPVGTTNFAKWQRGQHLKAARNKISLAYNEVLVECKKRNQRAPPGCLDSIISETKAEMGLPDDVVIKKSTLKNRFRCSAKSLTPAHPGTASPLFAIESLIVATIIQMGKQNQPMDKAAVLSFINDLIQETEFQDKVFKMKKILNLRQRDEELKKVGRGYYNGFLKRNGHLLQNKKGKRFALNRSQWMRPEYIEMMFDNIYDIFVDARVARKLDEPIAYDVVGNIVPIGSEKQYGHPSNIFIPPENLDLIFFCDETGINTCQKKDGHDGGKTYLVECGTEATLPANTSDHRATVLPILSARGELVSLNIIFMSDSAEPNALWASGIDLMVKPVVTQDGQSAASNPENYGPGKFCPGAMECDYKGKKVQTQFFTSPKGSITAEILVKILQYLDSLDLFERRPDGPEPCLVVDGHDSRLHPSFLKYINDPAHKWNVGLGVPYLTHLWQVGDASECNGSFKIQWSKAKQQLMDHKRRTGMPAKLFPEDMVPLLNKSVPLSFGKSDSNRRAIAERGWYPPTKKICDHRDLRDLVDPVENTPTKASTEKLLGTLGTTRGSCKRVMASIFDHVKRNEAIARYSAEERNGADAVATAAEFKKASSTMVFKAARSNLNKPMLLDDILSKEQKNRENLLAKRNKEKRRLLGLKQDIGLIRIKKSNDFEKWNKAELKKYLQYKKQNKDPKMPSDFAELRDRAIAYQHRASPTPSPCASDTEEDEDSLEQEDDIDIERHPLGGDSMQI